MLAAPAATFHYTILCLWKCLCQGHYRVCVALNVLIDHVACLQTAAAQTAVDECSGESSQNGALGMRWYLAQSPSQAQRITDHRSRLHHPAGSHAARAGSQDSATSMPNEIQGSSFQQGHYQYGRYRNYKALTASGSALQEATPSDVLWGRGTRIRVAVGCVLLCGYCTLLWLDC